MSELAEDIANIIDHITAEQLGELLALIEQHQHNEHAIPAAPPLPAYAVPAAPAMPPVTLAAVRTARMRPRPIYIATQSSEEQDIRSASAPTSPTANTASSEPAIGRKVENTPKAANSCGICYSDDSGVQLYICPNIHYFCFDCMRQYVAGKLAEHHTRITCPAPDCTCVLTDDDLRGMLLAETYTQLKRLETQNSNKHIRECPSCRTLVQGNPRRPDMQCTSAECGQAFCYYHELAHVGSKCTAKGPSVWQSVGTALWTAAHTRKCPACKHHIEKNGGCNHMTCRCGHEICTYD